MNEETTETPQEEKPSTPITLEQADAIADRLEKENNRREQLLRRTEELMARQRLGGRTDAGTTTEKPKEVSAQEYAQRVLEGKVQFKD